MLLAVNMPEQEPQVGQADRSISPSSASLTLASLEAIMESDAGDPLVNVSLAAYVSHIAEPMSDSAKRLLNERLKQNSLAEKLTAKWLKQRIAQLP